jgi:AraC-like DNA-binding protein
VTTIMLDAGFQTKSNFNREFRRVTGTSPSLWRAAQEDAQPPVSPPGPRAARNMPLPDR